VAAAVLTEESISQGEEKMICKSKLGKRIKARLVVIAILAGAWVIDWAARIAGWIPPPPLLFAILLSGLLLGSACAYARYYLSLLI
jgi:hypothetical protein